MAGVGQGIVFIDWYATGFRADRFAEALGEIAPIAMRYGASEHVVYRSRTDRYKFKMFVTFENKVDFERYWYGAEFADWRERNAGFFQIPVVYEWHDTIAQGALEPEPATD